VAGAPIRLNSLRNTERSIRELYVEIEGRTNVLAPIRMECSTTLSVILVNKTFMKTFWMVSRRVIGPSLVIEPLFQASLIGIKNISELDHLRGAWDLFSTY
jgi:hypothetical protein